MPELSSLHNDRVRTPAPETNEAVIARDATLGQPTQVTIPAFDEQLLWGPCEWTPYPKPDGLYYPKAGDRCAVVVPDGGDPWIVAWVPSAGAPDATYGGGV